MPPHLGLHCLPKYLFTFVQNEKGLTTDISGFRRTWFIQARTCENQGQLRDSARDFKDLFFLNITLIASTCSSTIYAAPIKNNKEL